MEFNLCDIVVIFWWYFDKLKYLYKTLFSKNIKMGNESTKSDVGNVNNNNTSSSTSTAQRIQKAIPNAIKSVGGSGSSTAIIQRALEQAKKSKTLSLKGIGMRIMSPLIDEVFLNIFKF